MSAKVLLLSIAAIFLAAVIPAHSQDTLPDGPGKDTVATVCTGCHQLSRIVGSGY